MLLTIPMGPIDANCYVLFEKDGGEAVLIDPSDAAAAKSALDAHGLLLTHILVTHRHFDHLAGAALLKEQTGCEVLIHPLDAAGLIDPDVARSAWMGGSLIPCEPTRLVQDGDTFSAAGYDFRVLHTPGHTAGGVTYVCDAEKIAFVGDTVFLEGFGRVDLPTGDLRALMRSILDCILTLPPEYTLLTGHGEPTTVMHETAHNPLLRYRRNPWFN